MAARFSALNRAQLSYDYLHTNSTTHEFLFGAIVEMVDNSKDAGANSCAIYTMIRPHLRGGRIMCFLDDGCGMTPEEAQAVTTFGYSAKRRDPNMIGQYGNGLKSGAMRIGKDMIVFTKKDDKLTCLFLSRTFHEEEGLDEIIVPTPSFTTEGLPIIVNQEKHNLEMDIILRYSPFHTMAEVMEQFNLLKNRSGTVVMVYNLKLLENGNPELDFEFDPYDIRVSDPDGGDKTLVPERSSLRAYLSVLYSTPRMKLYVNGKKVRTKRIVAGLYKPRQYVFTSSKFKMRAEQQIQELKESLNAVQERKKEAEMQLNDFVRKHGTNNVTDKEKQVQYRKLQDEITLRKNEIKRLKDSTQTKIKQLSGPKVLTFSFGLNIENRSHDGCFVYNNGRLIKMYEKAGVQKHGGVSGFGVVGIVDVPFTVMEPTHNKQDFADSREYRELLRAMGEHLDQFWRDLDLAAQPGGVVAFWEQFGYAGGTADRAPPSDEEKFVKKRMMNVNITLQCDSCLKWRILSFDPRYLKDGWPPDSWTCSQNPDTQNNTCRASEKEISIPKGKLEKETVTVEQKREQLQKKIEKHSAEAERLAGLATVRSRRDFSEAERKRKEKEQEEARRKEEEELAAAARRAAQQKKRPAPAAPPSRNLARTISIARNTRRPKSPSPPVAKKPRTKAELRKQMNQKKAVEQEDEDEEDEEFEVIRISPRKSQAEKISPLLIPLPRRNARKSFPSPIADQEEAVVAVTAPMKKAEVRKEEAHSSTTNGEQEQRPAVVDSDDQSASADDTVASTSKVGTSPTKPSGEARRDTRSSSDARTATSPRDDGDEETLKRLRKFLLYYLPPTGYKYSKNEISAMSRDQLLEIDLDDFCKAYESGLMALLHDEKSKAVKEKEKELNDLKQLCVQFLDSRGIELPGGGFKLPEGIDQAMREALKKSK